MKVRRVLAFTIVTVATLSLSAQSIVTVAGGGTQEGRPATVVQLFRPVDVALDAAGNLYIADSGAARLRKVAAGTGIMTSIAGNGLGTFSGDGGPATLASIAGPAGVAVDSKGNIFISVDSRIRRIDPAGIITTIAGTGSAGSSGDGGPATAAQLFGPDKLAVDRRGYLYINEDAGRRIRRIDLATGLIATVASTGPDLLFRDSGVAVDAQDNVYFSAGHTVMRLDAAGGTATVIAGSEGGFGGDGGPATRAKLLAPGGLGLDRAGNLYVADTGNFRIRRVTSDGGITTFAGTGSMAVAGDGGPASQASFSTMSGLAVDGMDNVYLTDGDTRKVRRIDAASGIITTIAGAPGECCFFSGDDGPATTAEMNRPIDVALDTQGNLYVGDSQNKRIRKVDARTGIITTVVKAAFTHLAVDAAGDIYISRYDELNGPRSHDVVKISAATGKFTTIAGIASLSGFSGDGGPATAALLNRPKGIAFDGAGNLFIAEGNKRIRRVAAGSGIITTVAGGGADGFLGDGGPATAASIELPLDVAVDGSGNLYIAATNRIRKVDANGTITTIAGGGSKQADGIPATEAVVTNVRGIAVSAEGQLFISQFTPFSPAIARVRVVRGGTITTLAGSGTIGFSGDAGPASAALLDEPLGLAADAIGNLYVADAQNDRVRLVAVCRALDAPLLRFPTDGSSGVSLSSRLAWERVAGAARYDVLLDTITPPRSVVASDLRTTSFAAANLIPNGRYYWQVVAKGDPYCVPLATSASPVRSFTTSSSCSATPVGN